MLKWPDVDAAQASADQHCRAELLGEGLSTANGHERTTAGTRQPLSTIDDAGRRGPSPHLPIHDLPPGAPMAPAVESWPARDAYGVGQVMRPQGVRPFPTSRSASWQQSHSAEATPQPSWHAMRDAGRLQLHPAGSPLQSPTPHVLSEREPPTRHESLRGRGFRPAVPALGASGGWQAPLSTPGSSLASPSNCSLPAKPHPSSHGHDVRHSLDPPHPTEPPLGDHLTGGRPDEWPHLTTGLLQTGPDKGAPLPAVDIHASPMGASLDSPASLVTPVSFPPEVAGDAFYQQHLPGEHVWTEPDGGFEEFVGHFVRHRLGKYATPGHPSRLEAEDTALLYRKLKVRIVDAERKVTA